MSSIFEHWKKVFLFLLIIFLFFITGFWSQKKLESDWQRNEVSLTVDHSETEQIPPQAKETIEPEIIWYYIDVKGEVYHPGVYKVSSDSRIQDVIQLAGGFTSDADELQINLALKVWDQMLLYVPKKGEMGQLVTVLIDPADDSKETVNINTATVTELMDLNGIGEKKAEAIFKYREENGKFKAVEDLLNVPGIGEGILANIREDISM